MREACGKQTCGGDHLELLALELRLSALLPCAPLLYGSLLPLEGAKRRGGAVCERGLKLLEQCGQLALLLQYGERVVVRANALQSLLQ